MLLSRCFFFLGTRVDQYSEIPWEHSLMPLPIYSIAAALIAKGRYHQRKQGFAVWSLGHSLLPLPAVVSPACRAQSSACQQGIISEITVGEPQPGGKRDNTIHNLVPPGYSGYKLDLARLYLAMPIFLCWQLPCSFFLLLACRETNRLEDIYREYQNECNPYYFGQARSYRWEVFSLKSCIFPPFFLKMKHMQQG